LEVTKFEQIEVNFDPKKIREALGLEDDWELVWIDKIPSDFKRETKGFRVTLRRVLKNGDV